MTQTAQIIHDLESQDIRLNLEGDKIKWVSNHKPDDQTLEEIRSHKEEIISFLSEVEISPYAERAAVHEYDGKLSRDWAETFAKLQFMDRPDQYTAIEWEQVINDAGLFGDKWAARARDLGWSIMDVFAVHKSENRKRLDGEGIILSLRGNKVVAITADHIMIETPTGSRQRICKPTAAQESLKTFVPLDESCL